MTDTAPDLAGAAEDAGSSATAALGPLVRRIDHVAIAVEDMRAAVALVHGLLGGEYVGGGDDDRLGIRTIQFRFPSGSKVELMSPLRDDASLRAHLDRHGQGFHHVAVFVDDLDQAIARLEGAGLRVVGTSRERPDWHEAYLHPGDGFGTLLQFAQVTRDWSTWTSPLPLEAVLDGEVAWVDSTPRRKTEGTHA